MRQYWTTIEGSRCRFLDFSQDPNGAEWRDASRQPHSGRVTYPADGIGYEKITKPQPYEASASARAASSAKKTSDSRDGGRISLKEDRMDAALLVAISTMGDGVLLTGSSSL